MKSLFIVSIVWLPMLFTSAVSEGFEKLLNVDQDSVDDDFVYDKDQTHNIAVILNENRLWPNGTIYYQVHPTAISIMDEVIAAFGYLEKKTCLKFVKNKSQGRILITAEESGCFSAVGRTGIVQKLNLGPKCRSFGMILHQLLHAIGLEDEHKRPDRDKYVVVNWDNIKIGEERHFLKSTPERMKTLSPFDYESIMMFGEHDHAKSPSLKTLIPRMPGITLKPIEKKTKMSGIDFIKLSQLYKCPLYFDSF